MSKDNTVIAGEIISALHDELYRAYHNFNYLVQVLELHS